MAKKIHPACNASPTMSAERYAAFVADVAERGLIYPIVLHKGQIIDGRHRQRACDELGIEAEYVVDDDLIEFGGDPWAFVWSSMMRKDHCESQLAMFAAARQAALKPQAKERQKRKPKDSVVATMPQQNGRSRDQAAAEYGIGGRTVSKAANVIANGCPQLQEAVRDGRINVTLAEQVVKRCDADAQKEAVAVALVSPKPEKALRESIRKPEPKGFDEDREVDRLVDLLRAALDRWPEPRRPVALNTVLCIVKEYKP